MSAIAGAPFDAAAGDRLAKRNALVLAMGRRWRAETTR